MPLIDYIIDHRGVDWSTILKEWRWLLPDRFTVWLMNRFGDLFLVLDDESIHMLDVGGGSLKKVAESREDFINKADEGDNANQWLMLPLIDRLVAAGVALGPGQCYSYKRPPVLGGAYTVENTYVTSIEQHCGFFGELYGKMKDLPDGTKVTIDWTE